MQATKNNKIQNTFLEKNGYSKNIQLPKTICKDLMFFLNVTEQEVSKIIEFALKIKNKTTFKSLENNNIDCLTNKEQQIFNLVANGLATKQIASKLNIQASTVSTHRKRIKQKLKLQTNYDWFQLASQ